MALLERIISIASRPGDTILDPFCGSGTTLAASIMLDRNAIGIDVSEDAVNLTRQRIRNHVRSESKVLVKGRDSYRNADETALSFLYGLDYVPVQRNSGIDAILKDGVNGAPVPIRVQRENETRIEAASKLYKASKGKGATVMFLIATRDTRRLELVSDLPRGVVVIDSPSALIRKRLADATN